MNPYFRAHFLPTRPNHSGWLIALFILMCAALHVAPVDAAEPLLTNNQRKIYLRYYAPVILKMASESATTKGRDWITNYAFDRDKTFSNNRTEWQNNLAAYVDGNAQYADWKIRPTLYTALIEFKEGTGKSVVLLYHVYHAMEQGDVHDWERVEIRVDNVSGTPGTGLEKVRYVVATQHSTHVPLQLADVKFMQLPGGGKHPLILQGPWTDGSGLRKNELRHVKTPWATIDTAVRNCATGPCANATVDVTNLSAAGTTTAQRVNYVFVPERDDPAVAYWGAVAVAPGPDGKLNDKAAGTAAAVKWNTVKRLTYELQDLADILPTHANTAACGTFPTEQGWSPANSHWSPSSDKMSVLMTNSIRTEGTGGTVLVPSSANCGGKPIVNYCYSLDGGSNDTAQGYPCKHWFWGAYITGIDEGSYTDEAFAGKPFYDSTTSSNPKTRNCKGTSGKMNPYFCQNDYFAHVGKKGSAGSKLVEEGRWLPLGWHTPAQGGFDGRWVQLFTDYY